ncbi:carbohydrate ABC transporter permease [Natronococcus roseus]|uniref:carbohydrate ABC transporter permease n=1 Tax=Natronococcus roseus TaxID=1052014 RepID=UPI00374CA141
MSDRNSGIEEYRGTTPVWSWLSYLQRRRVVSAVRYGLLAIVAIVVFFPVFWMFNSALRPVQTLVTTSPDIFTTNVTLENYVELFTETRFPTYLRNSIIITSGVVLLTTVLATLGGYGLARINIPRKKYFARGILFGYMFPAILLAIPMYILWSNIGMTNSFLGLMLAISARSLPFSLWLMWQFFQTVPESLEESAVVAGASRFQAFVDVALPMAKPGIIAVSIFSFSIAWGDYTFALVIMSDIDLYPITIGLESSFIPGQHTDWELLMAGASIAVIPPLLFVFFLQKYFLQGFSPGGT